MPDPAIKRGAARETRVARLAGREVAYTLKRRRRSRNIYLKVDQEGLAVSAPLKASISWIESVLQDKTSWILRKLEEWEGRKSPQLIWREGALFPFLGRNYRLTLAPQGTLWPMAAGEELVLGLACGFDPKAVEAQVMAWYRNEALACFRERTAVYATRLGVPYPRVSLSDAKTLWGSCSAQGGIRLNWKLIQLPLQIIDYVIAHELAHLKEMNHSRAFWDIVAKIYPDYAQARNQLRKLG